MHDFKSIFRLIDSEVGYGQPEWDDFKARLSGVEQELFDLIYPSNKLSDEELAQKLFRTDPKHKDFGALKLKLYKKVSRELLNYRPNMSSSTRFQKAVYYTILDFAVFNLLIGKGRRQLAFQMAKRIFRHAKDYHQTLINYSLSLFIFKHYGSHLWDSERAEYYYELSKKYSKILALERDANYLNAKITAKIYGKSKTKDEEMLALKKELDKLPIPTLDVESYHYPFSYYISKISLELFQGNYSNIIEECKKACVFFEQLPYDHHALISNFIAQQTSAYLQLGMLDEAKVTIDRLNQRFSADRIQWYNLKEVALLICINRKEYQDAYDICQEVVNQTALNAQVPYVQESWRLFEAYLAFLLQINVVEDNNPKRKKFRVKRFLNDVPKFDTQKQLMNIPIIIAQLLFAIAEKDYDAIEDRVMALKSYCSKYLKKDSENFRSNCFIKMLLKIPISNFHPISTRRNASLFYDRLREMPLKLSPQRVEIEVIPYEDLWEIILEFLKRPKRKRTSLYTRKDFMENARSR